MPLCPCRFNVPLMDNEGRAIDPQAIVDLHRELLGQFEGFTIHPTSQGRWQSRAGRVYHGEVAGLAGVRITQSASLTNYQAEGTLSAGCPGTQRGKPLSQLRGTTTPGTAGRRTDAAPLVLSLDRPCPTVAGGACLRADRVL